MTITVHEDSSDQEEEVPSDRILGTILSFDHLKWSGSVMYTDPKTETKKELIQEFFPDPQFRRYADLIPGAIISFQLREEFLTPEIPEIDPMDNNNENTDNDNKSKDISISSSTITPIPMIGRIYRIEIHSSVDELAVEILKGKKRGRGANTLNVGKKHVKDSRKHMEYTEASLTSTDVVEGEYLPSDSTQEVSEGSGSENDTKSDSEDELELDLWKQIEYFSISSPGKMKDASTIEDTVLGKTRIPISHIFDDLNYEDDDNLSTSTAICIGVLDGHGGRNCVKYTEANLTTSLTAALMSPPKKNPGSALNRMKTAISRAFSNLNRNFIDSIKKGTSMIDISGTTVCLCIVYGPDSENDNKMGIITAHVGDSRAVLCKRVENGTRIAHRLTEDHKPNRSDEYSRITSLPHGRVIGDVECTLSSKENTKKTHSRRKLKGEGSSSSSLNDGTLPCDIPRVLQPPLSVLTKSTGMNRCVNTSTAISVSRSIGDYFLKVPYDYITAVPEISDFFIDEEDEFIILGTDGVFDVFTDGDLIDEIGRILDYATIDVTKDFSDSEKMGETEGKKKRREETESVGDLSSIEIENTSIDEIKIMDGLKGIIRECERRGSEDDKSIAIINFSWVSRHHSGVKPLYYFTELKGIECDKVIDELDMFSE